MMTKENIIRFLWPALIISLAVKLMLAAAIPITSDEAYFTVWGMFPRLGYYDHPPMVGWILYILSFVGHCLTVIRLPAVLSTIFIALGLYALLKPLDEIKAALITVFFLVSPLNILNVLVTTDTPLIFFCFLSAFLLYYALKNESRLFYVSSGVALGCAFLSKYFAVFLGIAYVVYFFIAPKDKKKTTGFILLFASALPFAIENIYWNYTHCWSNIMFNVFNRNKGESFSLLKMLLYVLCQAYLLTPAVVYFLVKRYKDIISGFDGLKKKLNASGLNIFAAAFAAPVLLFALLSVKKVVGLHWLLGFYPFMYLILFYILSEQELVITVKATAVFTIIHLFIIGTALSVPVKYFHNYKDYSAIIIGARPAELKKYLIKYESDFVVTTPSYADSALLTYNLGGYFPVFGGGSQHGREDDLLTDYRKYNGKNILVLRGSEPRVNEYSTFFKDIEIERITVDEAQFFLVCGYDFNFENYKNLVLKEIKDKYYNIPPWLPCKPGSSIMKYFD